MNKRNPIEFSVESALPTYGQFSNHHGLKICLENPIERTELIVFNKERIDFALYFENAGFYVIYELGVELPIVIAQAGQ